MPSSQHPAGPGAPVPARCHLSPRERNLMPVQHVGRPLKRLEDPKLIKSSRVMRIARGSGTTPKDVKELIKQYNMSKKAMKGFMGNRKMRRQLMKQFKGMDISAKEA